MYDQTVLTALIAWPAIAAVAVLAAPARWAKHLALAGSLLEFAISVPLWWVFQPAGGMQLQLDVPWIPSWGIHYTVGVDGISLLDRKSTRLNSSHSQISYAVFCLKKKKTRPAARL